MLVDTLLPNVSVGNTHFVVLKLEMNALGTITTGNDRVSVWINPTDITNEGAAGAPDATFTDFSLSQPDHIQRLVLASDNFGNQASYDEHRFGTAWGDAAPQQDLVARDNFEAYAAGANLNPGPLNAGQGWGGAWTAEGGTLTFSVEDPGTPLAYSDTGVYHNGGQRALRVRGFGATGGGSERSVRRSLDAPESGDLFASFLIRWDGAFETDDFVDFRFLDGGSRVGRFGIKGDFAGGGGDFFAELGTTGAGGPAGLQFDPTDDHLLVARLFKDQGSSTYNALSFWVDPVFTDFTNPDYTHFNDSGLSGVNAIRILQRDLEDGEFVWLDQVHLGASWEDVVLYPEPTTLTLLTLGGLGILSRRRRR